MSNGSVLLLDLHANGKLLSLLFVLQYIATFSDRLDAWHFVLGMLIDRHKFYMTSQRHPTSATAVAWLQHWIQFGGREAIWLQCAGPKTDMLYILMAEEEDY